MEAVDHFVTSSQELFDSKLINFIQNIRNLKNQKELSNLKKQAWKFSKMHLRALIRQEQMSIAMKDMRMSATLFMIQKSGGDTTPNSMSSFSSINLPLPVSKLSAISNMPYKFQFNIPTKKPNNSGTLYRLINGVKCFIKYHIV